MPGSKPSETKSSMNPRSNPHRKAYTLIEALVASSILLIGIAAAASMSLSFVTQEEITERAARAFNFTITIFKIQK